MDQTEKELEDAPDSKHSDLCGWVMERVERWRQSRDSQYRANWDKYYDIWSGHWSHDLKGKQAERSRLIAPATQNAVDQTVSEMVEATFGRGVWFDIDDYEGNPQLKMIAEANRDNLLEDFQRDRLSSSVTDTYYNGAIFGTGIAKRIIERGSVNRVYWQAIRPHNFVIDTAALTIDDALGCAHEEMRPKHEIEDKQRAGEYLGGPTGDTPPQQNQLSPTSDIMNLQDGYKHDVFEVDPQDGVYVTEYHGKVPLRFLKKEGDEESPDADLLEATEGEDEETYTEAIVLIANGTFLLKAEPNPITDSNNLPDRGFLAYQHHKRPNAFWGIGQVEKAFNAQSALDAELRARIDALGLLTYPVIGADATRLPKNLNLQITPGKTFLTNGPPSEVIQPLTFGNLNPASFQQSADFERMVQLATGANDPSMQIDGPGSPNSTASGVSMAQASFIKRAKLTMQNVDTDFLEPLVKKTLWAYMKVSPDRYPRETAFNVNSTMSIMAREFEQMQMTNLLAIIPQESPAFAIILKGIVENYSGPSKEQIVAAIEKMSQPDPQQQQVQQMTQQLTLQKMQREVQLVEAQIQEISARAGLNQAKTKEVDVKSHQSGQQLDIQAAQTLIQKRATDIQEKGLGLQAAKLAIEREKLHKQPSSQAA